MSARSTLSQIGLLLMLLVRGVLLWIVVPVSAGWWLIAIPIGAMRAALCERGLCNCDPKLRRVARPPRQNLERPARAVPVLEVMDAAVDVFWAERPVVGIGGWEMGEDSRPVDPLPYKGMSCSTAGPTHRPSGTARNAREWRRRRRSAHLARRTP